MKSQSNNDNLHNAVGRRKSAIARVSINSGKGEVSVSDKTIKQEDIDKNINAILEMVGLKGKFDVKVILQGGGVSSRLDAIRMATARAIVKYDSELKTTLRKAGFLTRDAREKERKKPGLKGARKAPQWAKR